MLAWPREKAAGRSNCRPAVTVKSAGSTTRAQGPGQPAGGAEVNTFGGKAANFRLWKSGTTQGGVCGRETGGSAVIGFEEPICGEDGTRTTCACAARALPNSRQVSAARRCQSGKRLRVVDIRASSCSTPRFAAALRGPAQRRLGFAARPLVAARASDRAAWARLLASNGAPVACGAPARARGGARRHIPTLQVFPGAAPELPGAARVFGRPPQGAEL